MLKHSRLALVALLVLLVLAFSSSGVLAQGPQPPEKPAAPSGTTATIPGLAPWFGAQIDNPIVGTGNRGQYPSVVNYASTTYVSYYDAVNKDLKVAHYVGAGATGLNLCGPGNTWRCETIDSTGDVGQYSSMAVDLSTGALHVGVAYYDATNQALKYVSYSCIILVGCSWSTPVTIYDSSVNPLLSYAGKYASLKFDSTGKAHIASQIAYSVLFPETVLYAHSVTSGGNCGVGAAAAKWQCDVIDSGTGRGMYNSLDVNPYDYPRIASYDSNTKDLRYAFYLGTASGNCGPGNTWRCVTVDSAGDVGRFASLKIDQASNAQFAYYDATNGKLKHAAWVGTGGNCGDLIGGETVWQCDAIDDMGTGLTQAGISLALDLNNHPWIAYQDASDSMAPAALKIARPDEAVAQFFGNCGPVILFHTWQCSTLDGGGSYTSEADYASISFNSAGLATVAYYEWDDYYTAAYLKVKYQRWPLYLPLVLK